MHRYDLQEAGTDGACPMCQAPFQVLGTSGGPKPSLADATSWDPQLCLHFLARIFVPNALDLQRLLGNECH